jgi:hypothetical protein
MTWDAVGYMGRGRGKIADIAVIAAIAGIGKART